MMILSSVVGLCAEMACCGSQQTLIGKQNTKYIEWAKMHWQQI